MIKPAFCICKNKGADQLHGNHTADQRLFFRYIVLSLYFLNPQFPGSQFVLDLVVNPKDRFSHDVAQTVNKIKMTVQLTVGTYQKQKETCTFQYEPRREKNGFLHMRKQRRRSASR